MEPMEENLVVGLPIEDGGNEESVVEETLKAEPLKINTHGEWELIEHFMEQKFEVGKTYRISVAGHCQFMISAEQPTVGMTTNEITYTKQEGQNLWIKTGE